MYYKRIPVLLPVLLEGEQYARYKVRSWETSVWKTQNVWRDTLYTDLLTNLESSEPPDRDRTPRHATRHLLRQEFTPRFPNQHLHKARACAEACWHLSSNWRVGPNYQQTSMHTLGLVYEIAIANAWRQEQGLHSFDSTNRGQSIRSILLSAWVISDEA